jgi:hypothetical protein
MVKWFAVGVIVALAVLAARPAYRVIVGMAAGDEYPPGYQ